MAPAPVRIPRLAAKKRRLYREAINLAYILDTISTKSLELTAYILFFPFLKRELLNAKMPGFPAGHFSINQYKPNQATSLSVDFEKK